MKEPICPEVFTTAFARELIEFLGGDSSKIEDSDCWRSLGKKYKHLRGKVEEYFENAEIGDPSYAAYYMVYFCGSSREWAEGIKRKTEK